MWDAELVKQLCGEQFELGAEKLVDFLFDAAASLPGTDDFRTAPFLELPIVGGVRFWAGHEPLCLRQQVFNALCAREQFRRTAPRWAPDLPLRNEAIRDLEMSSDNRLRLLGYFAGSQRSAVWDTRHPFFARFASGLMAYESTPEEIRDDVSLRYEYPPDSLEGLCDGWMSWRSPDTLALDRQMLAMIAASEARRG